MTAETYDDRPQVDDEDPTPRHSDVAAFLAGGLPQPPAPTVLHRTDGHALFYAGKVNIVFGDPEGGKTWVCLAAVAEALDDPNSRVAVFDIDHNGLGAILANLLLLGVPENVVKDDSRFRHYEPTDGWELLAMTAAATEWAPTLAIFDSIGELMGMLAKSSNDPDEWTAANRRVLQPIANAGACVIAVDHLAKNADSRRMGTGGTAAKRRSPGGAMVRVTVRDQFTPGEGGSASLTINKDRHGGLRAASKGLGTGAAGEDKCGLFTLEQTEGQLTWAVQVRSADDTNEQTGGWIVSNTDLAEVDGLTDDERSSVRKVRAALGWRTDRATAVLKAWRQMEA